MNHVFIENKMRTWILFDLRVTTCIDIMYNTYLNFIFKWFLNFLGCILYFLRDFVCYVYHSMGRSILSSSIQMTSQLVIAHLKHSKLALPIECAHGASGSHDRIWCGGQSETTICSTRCYISIGRHSSNSNKYYCAP